jgi:hypothetical protein
MILILELENWEIALPAKGLAKAEEISRSTR